ncbi:MAG: hypothetical protein ACOZQL_42535 [Myxococcota bacterium]
MRAIFLVCVVSLGAWAQDESLTPPPPPPPESAVAPAPATPPSTVSRPRSPRSPERLALESPVPPGFHEVTAVRKGMLIAGLAIFGGTYASSVYIGAMSGAAWAFVPVVGPFVLGAQLLANPGGSLPFFSGIFGVALMAVGAAQAAGLTMTIISLAVPHRWMERDQPAATLRLELTPGGLALAGRF